MNRIFIFLLFGFLFFGVFSCISEKAFTSPIGDFFKGSFNLQNFSDKTTKQPDIVYYSAQLTNEIENLPNTKNENINQEIQHLKQIIKYYIQNSQREHSLEMKKNTLGEIEKSYHRLQEEKNSLNEDEQELLNIYLVKIKGFIGKLENLQ